MSESDLNYYRRRERQERSAAKAAKGIAARRAHQAMALRYSILLLWQTEALLAA